MVAGRLVFDPCYLNILTLFTVLESILVTLWQILVAEIGVFQNELEVAVVKMWRRVNQLIIIAPSKPCASCGFMDNHG